MTAKDYIAFADILSAEIAVTSIVVAKNRAAGCSDPYHTLSEGAIARRETVRRIALSMTDVFARDNHNFDRVRFLTACGFTADDCPMTFADAEADKRPGYDGTTRFTA